MDSTIVPEESKDDSIQGDSGGGEMSNQTRKTTEDQNGTLFRLALIATGVGMLLSVLV